MEKTAKLTRETVACDPGESTAAKEQRAHALAMKKTASRQPQFWQRVSFVRGRVGSKAMSAALWGSDVLKASQ